MLSSELAASIEILFGFWLTDSKQSAAVPTWLSEEIVRTLHAELISEHGGLPGPSRSGALGAALARPQNVLAYGNREPSVARLAAAYGFAFARGHCFPDGNKRVALSTMDVFLQLNGYELVAPDGPDMVATIRALAASEISEEQLAAWVDANCKALTE
jgi:death on curing protein